MELGISTFPTEDSIGVRALGRALEDRGFESLFVPEHTHIPTSRLTPNPGGGDLPDVFRRTPDPFVVLGALAACTERLLLGTGVCLVVERDPIVTAKAVATVDRLSEGRFLFGVGAGWNREEMRHHGTDFSRRFTLLRERVLAMKEIWTRDVAEFHGEMVDFEPIWQWPKPLQVPHPPVIVAGNGAASIRRAADYGEAWMPIAGRGDIEAQIEMLRLAAGERDRDPIPVTVFGAPPKPELLERYAAAGVDRTSTGAPPMSARRCPACSHRTAGRCGASPSNEPCARRWSTWAPCTGTRRRCRRSSRAASSGSSTGEAPCPSTFSAGWATACPAPPASRSWPASTGTCPTASPSGPPSGAIRSSSAG